MLRFSLEQLRAVVQESNHKREEEIYANAMNSKEKENLLETERTLIASKLAELSEEQSKKMLQKEIRLREDAQTKFVTLEKVCLRILRLCLKISLTIKTDLKGRTNLYVRNINCSIVASIYSFE